MHWGLATFEKKRIEMIALDHPYFDTHAPLLTKREIAAIVKEGSHKNGYQVIAEVMAELGLTYVPAKHKKRSFREALRDMSFVPSFRRSVALGLLCLLLVLFMTFTAPGRAFAEELYSIVIEFIDHTLGIHNNIPSSNQICPSFSSLPGELQSPKDLAMVLNTPILISNDRLLSFEYESIGDDMLVIRSSFQTDDNHVYSLVQTVYGPDTLWTSSINSDDGYEEIQTRYGLTIYVGKTADGTVFGLGFTNDSSIRVTSASLSISEIKECVDSLLIAN